jgi:L-iditol 2-dehydrogenase
VLGHEFSGVILEKGKNVDPKWQIGDRVCGDLETMNGRIGVHVNGAYAERMTIPQRLVHRLPENLSLEEGALVEQVTCMSHSLMYRSRILPGDFVVLLGPGPIGLTMLQMVRLYSPRSVMVTGLRSDAIRLAKAKELGADMTFNSEDDPAAYVKELTQGEGADLVIDCTRGDAALGQAVRMVKNGGWITIIGVWGHELRVNLDSVPYNNLTIRGGWGWGGDGVCRPSGPHGRWLVLLGTCSDNPFAGQGENGSHNHPSHCSPGVERSICSPRGEAGDKGNDLPE